MFDLEKREKSILLVLLAILLIGLAFGSYQKRVVPVDVRSDNFTYTAEDTPVDVIKVNINISDAAQLEKLKGVGKVLADRIVEYRSKNGNFSSIEGLKKVKGIGGKLYEKIKDEVSID
ncbi:MAG: helix-hairpin-helix domain-containing protein [Candidatus Omnitrophica bacterium]|nr:helix-hairpin-helix domain-containing protein [Candidatus Omnitrophota bacterium]